MVWWLERIEASGYNRYIVLKMTHLLEWENSQGKLEKQWGYFFGPGNATIQYSIRTATGKAIYSENNNLHTFITTQNESLCRDLYFEVVQGNIHQGYVVKEFDINSTPGINYITVDPVPARKEISEVIINKDDKKEEIYWLNGGM
jgi:hypothetical protein